MAMAKKVLAIILSLAVLSSTALACTGYNKLDLVKTDNIILKRSDIRDQENCYSVLVDFDIPTNGFQTALSISNFYSLKTTQGYDYSIRGGQRKGTNYLVISVIVSQLSQWTMLSVSYLATARNDIFAGSFLADAYSQFDCSTRSNRDLAFNYNVPALTSYIPNTRYQVRVFISGVKVRDQVFNFKFRSASFNPLNGLLEVAAYSDAFPFIETLQISYVIYRPNLDFAISFIPSAAVKDEDYAFYHTNCFTKSEPEFLALTLVSDRLKGIGRGCSAQCYTTQQCLAAGGSKYGRNCYICGKYQRLDNWQCVPACDTQFEDYINGECVCKPGFRRNSPVEPCRPICSLNEIWDGRCVCRQGCGRYSGNCIVCPPNSKASGQQCICDLGFYWNARKMICELNFCPPNASPFQTVSGAWDCKCNNPNEYFNPERKMCQYVNTCLPNSKLDLVYNQVNKYKSWACVCNPGYYWNTKSQKCDYLAPCGDYAVPTFVGNQWVCVCKSDCYAVGKICKPLPICPPNTRFNPLKEQCECINPGEYFHNGACRSCGKYEQYNVVQKRFVCIGGYNYVNGLCAPQCSEYEDFISGNCVCKSNCYYNQKKCAPCPPYSRPNADRTLCICNDGYVNQGSLCVEKKVVKCPEGMEWSVNGCVCNGYMDGGRCRPIPTCPIKSKWNQQKLRCECTVVGQYLIDNVCQSCQSNQGWNGKQCACVTGYFKVGGVCRTCDINSYHNGKECVCNIGFYGNPLEKCMKCHSSCGRCLGPKQDQCTMCSDVSYNLVKGANGCGVCTRNSPCPVGLYKQKGQCRPCSSYCAECQSETLCKTCISGFQINQMAYDGCNYAYCVEICGDGKRFELDCDDGNTKNGDGCNSDCQIEKGWHCQGGSSIKSSNCAQFLPSRCFVSMTGTVHLFGKVVQGVRLSYIPPALTANDCMDCHKLLWVRVISSSVVPGVRVNYLPKSQYQFLTEFDFNGLFAIPVFTISIQINPDFAKYFNEADLAQIQVKAIDPAVLATAQVEQALDAQSISSDFDQNLKCITQSPATMNLLFPVDSTA